jgi:hypothetical protein
VFSIWIALSISFGQSEATVKKAKEKYEKKHPGERTYFVDEIAKLLDSAEEIMPNARAMTFKRSDEIGGAIFGSSVSWKKSKEPNQVDGFTKRYVKDDKLKQVMTENLLTDASAFARFIEDHRKNGFYRVVVWAPGYVMFYMIEGRENRTGINYILIPSKPEFFNIARAYGAKNQ